MLRYKSLYIRLTYKLLVYYLFNTQKENTMYSYLDVNGVGHENTKGINHFFAK